MPLTWPDNLKARSCNVHPRNFFRSGGRSLAGTEQRVMSDAGYLEVSYAGIVIRRREQAASYRAMLARLRAGESVLLSICDVYRPRGARGATITLAANAALRATQLQLAANGIEITAGHHLSIGERLHIVTEVVAGPSAPPLLNQLVRDVPWSDAVPWTDAVEGSVSYTVNILPPLREAAVAGAAVTFDTLTLRAKLMDAAGGDLDLDLGRFGSPSITFIEDF